MKRKKVKLTIKKILLTCVAVIFAVSFLLPTILTIANSFMSSAEINTNYGVIFNQYKETSYGERNTDYVAEKVNLKFIPDMVELSQYTTVLLKSPEYLLKFWNSVILVVPIVVFQIFIALGAAYSFMRFRGRIREIIFFVYVALMLMPYQVTLVPNYLVADWLKILDTRASIILPGIFAPFSVYLLTKFMRRIPNSLIEAAKLDGANEWQIFTKVCIPLCKGPIASVAILVFIDYWNMVEQPLIMLSDADKHPLSVFLSQINTGEVGLAFAVATIYMVPPILIFLYGEEYLVDGISYSGGVKG
ncbi:MAG: carbohydrate ABC transporter permease [Clostridium sp.]|mgnify:FL=1|nr:carbohydrate ABC transporter permease [Clostridium sp.]